MKLRVCLMLALLLMAGGALGFWFSQPELETIEVRYVPAQPAMVADSFMAGAATVDITPPPGYLPRAGYATWSTIGEGFRTRLYARVYYLRDRQGDSHLLVQTDLTSGSRLLHTQLGERLARDTDIDAGNLTITATHTHSGPGQFLGSQFYNKHISNVPGFAEDYFEFLLDRLDTAAREAIRGQQPARLATGSIDIWGLTRNRSIQAYVENRTVANKSEADNRTFHSVNPALTMVRIDTRTPAGTYQPLGAFASFSIHGTALPQAETLFNADVWAYIHKDWEWAVQRAYQPDQPIHISAFEGTHGDVAPAARFGMLGYIEARRIGEAIAAKAFELYRQLDAQMTEEVDLRTVTRHVNLREQPRIGDIEICADAAIGNTLAAAPLEHTSPVIGYLPFLEQGSRRWGEEADNCQGRKRILGFSALQPLLEPKDSFPDYVLFQLVQINQLVLVPLPFELTTESGRRISRALEEVYGQSGSRHEFLIASLAGGYTGYVTTPEEYDRQYYEGGHTLYGKHTQPYLAAQLQALARDALKGGSLRDLPQSWRYRIDKVRFMPEPIPVTGRRRIVQAPQFSHAQINEEGHWRFQWLDVNPTAIDLHRPLLSIETRLLGQPWEPLKQAGVPVNDAGYDLAVRVLNKAEADGMAVYEGYWFNPLFEGERREYRFVVEPRGDQARFYSSAFQ